MNRKPPNGHLHKRTRWAGPRDKQKNAARTRGNCWSVSRKEIGPPKMRECAIVILNRKRMQLCWQRVTLIMLLILLHQMVLRTRGVFCGRPFKNKVCRESSSRLVRPFLHCVSVCLLASCSFAELCTTQDAFAPAEWFQKPTRFQHREKGPPLCRYRLAICSSQISPAITRPLQTCAWTGESC